MTKTDLIRVREAVQSGAEDHEANEIIMQFASNMSKEHMMRLLDMHAEGDGMLEGVELIDHMIENKWYDE